MITPYTTKPPIEWGDGGEIREWSIAADHCVTSDRQCAVIGHYLCIVTSNGHSYPLIDLSKA